MTVRFAPTVGMSMLAWGLLSWPLAHGESPALGASLVSGVIAGLVGGMLPRPGLARPALAVAAGFDLAVLARVVVDTTRDATTHNLWPLELVFMGVFGFLTGFLGVGVARLLQRMEGARQRAD